MRVQDSRLIFVLGEMHEIMVRRSDDGDEVRMYRVYSLEQNRYDWEVGIYNVDTKEWVVK